MSAAKKKENFLIAEFDKLIAENKKNEVKVPLIVQDMNVVDLGNWLRPFVENKMGDSFDNRAEAVNVHLELGNDAKSGIVRVVVFSGESLPALPRNFWVKNGETPFLCEPVTAAKWHEANLQIFHEKQPEKMEFSVPYFFIEVPVKLIELPAKTLMAEFHKSVMTDTGDAKPHLKLILCETVYNLSRQIEFQSLADAKSPEDMKTVLKKQYDFKMREWKNKLAKLTTNQASRNEKFTVTEKDFQGLLLSQNEVDNLLKPFIKKDSN